MAATSGDAAAKKGGGLLGLLIPVVILTVLAAGGGGLIGSQILAAVKGSVAAEPKPAAVAKPEQDDGSALKELSPIVTNLAGANSGSWIRLQAAIVYQKADTPQIEILSAKISDDILTLLRTLTLEELQGASGLELLREDLNERASIRSDGHIKELMIEMLVVQ